MKVVAARISAFASMMILATGCASGSGSEWTSNDAPLPAYAQGMTVQVQNHNWSDMVVYAVRYTSRVRLGMVTSMNSRKFKVPNSVAVSTGGLELVAEAIGSQEQFVTGPINVQSGQLVELKLQNQLPISTWSVW
jgi:hypothetical protein